MLEAERRATEGVARSETEGQRARTRALQRVRSGVRNTGVGIGDTGISLPTPIPIRSIADRMIPEKDNYYAIATAEAIIILAPYLEHTKHYQLELAGILMVENVN